MEFEEKVEILKLYVVKEEGPAILGRDWLMKLNIPIQSDISFLSECNNNNVVLKFPAVFKDDLGYYKYKEFGLSLKENVKPIFCKPRVLPFALRQGEWEIDR